MNSILKRLVTAIVVGAALAGCSGGGSSEDPRPPGEACTSSNYNQERWRDSVLWRCTREWNGSKYNYFWTAIRRIYTSDSAEATALPDRYIAVLDGSVVDIRNGAGEPTWNFKIAAADQVPALPVKVSSDGTKTVEPSGFVTPQQVQCFGAEGVDCLGLTLRGTGPTGTLRVDPATGKLDFEMGIVVEVQAVQGFSGLGTGCKIGPASGRLAATDYAPAAGTATLRASGLPLQAVGSCGDQNDLFNQVLGLPGTVEVTFVTKVKL